MRCQCLLGKNLFALRCNGLLKTNDGGLLILMLRQQLVALEEESIKFALRQRM